MKTLTSELACLLPGIMQEANASAEFVLGNSATCGDWVLAMPAFASMPSCYTFANAFEPSHPPHMSHGRFTGASGGQGLLARMTFDPGG